MHHVTHDPNYIRPTVVHRATRLHRPRDIQGIVFDMDGALRCGRVER